MRLRYLLVAAVAVVFALPATAALPAAATTPAPATGDQASLRLAHLSPTTRPMDVYATPFNGDQTVLLEGVGYGAMSDYIRTAPGSYVFSWRAAGASADSAPQLTMSAVLEPGAAYTVAGIDAGRDVRSVLIDDDLTPPAAGEARVRFIHADSDAGSVDLQAVDGPVIVRDAEFASVTGYASVPAGPWILDVVSEQVPAGAAMSVNLQPGSVSTLLLLESDSPTGDLTAIVDSGGLTPIGDASAMSLTMDAAGAPAAPDIGGVATGAGGTAAPTPIGLAVSGAVVLAAVLAGVAVILAGAKLLRRARPARS